MKRIALTYILPFLLAVLVAIILYKSIIKTDFTKKEIKLEIVLDASQDSDMQFIIEDDKSFKIENIQTIHIPEAKNLKVEFTIPILKQSGRLRIDPSYSLVKCNIHKITLVGLSKKIEFTGESLKTKFTPTNDIKSYELNNDGSLYIESNGNDSNITSEFYFKQYENTLSITPHIYLFPLLISICIGIFVLYLVRKKLVALQQEEITAQHIILCGFIIIITLPGVWMTLFPVNKISESENRILKSKPVFNFTNITKYPKEYSEYFEDNFGFKKELSTLNSLFKYKFFNSSSKPNTVCVGKDGWLFSVDPINSGDYQNKTLYTNEELNTIKHNLEEIKRWYEKRGIHFFVMVLPIKSSIYPEYLPDNMKKKNTISKLNQLSAYLEQNSAAKIIDVTPELLNAKKTQVLYYKHDIHWNFNGGYLGYKKLINEMSKFNSDLKPISLINYKESRTLKNNADLSKQLSLENILVNNETDLNRITKYPFDEVAPTIYSATSLKQATRRTAIKNSKLPKAVVYRDSFFNLMITFFSENFSDCVYLWTNNMTLEVIEKEMPGYVVYEIIESDIDKLLEDNPDWIKNH
jgi:hypothetical protein